MNVKCLQSAILEKWTGRLFALLIVICMFVLLGGKVCFTLPTYTSNADTELIGMVDLLNATN
ncbi:hypothetical protein [Lamposivirus ageladense]|uniref:Uncharacterized protein n=1 Tax=Circoviridae sp. TaxID=1954248 RepID=A0ABY4CDH6_9VIRU|nr:hypothetical protein [Circoviridae sp.]